MCSQSLTEELAFSISVLVCIAEESLSHLLPRPNVSLSDCTQFSAYLERITSAPAYSISPDADAALASLERDV